MLSRRDFLGTGGSFLTWGALGYPLGLFAAPTEDHLFVLINVFGGMDVTLGLDPLVMPPGADENDVFIEYRPEEILISGEVSFAPAAKPLLPWASDCLVINGVMMRRDAGHDVVNQYMISGRGDGKGATVTAELELATGSSSLGIVANNSLYLAGKAVSLTSLQNLLNEKDPEALMRWVEERLEYEASLKGTPFEEAQRKIVNSRSHMKKFMEHMETFRKKLPKAEEKHALVAALASGGSRHAEYQIFGASLDSHSNHPKNHLQAQIKVWEQVAELFSLCKGIPYMNGNLFDYTTFMIVSEFSRTPFLNAAKGKDHNPLTNSVLLAGKGIRKGKVVGKSKIITRKQSGNIADHMASPFNYKEGKVATSPTGASFIFPENVIRTVGAVFGNQLGSVASSVAVVPGIAL